jgi:hypothetical protein
MQQLDTTVLPKYITFKADAIQQTIVWLEQRENSVFTNQGEIVLAEQRFLAFSHN